MMRILSVLLAIAILYLGYLHMQVKAHPQLQYNALSDRIFNLFDTRLRFRVERVDSGFGISQDEVIALSKQAVEIWHQGTGRNDLLVYDENAKLSIQLIFDHRQQEYNALKQATQKLLSDEATYNRQANNLIASRDDLDLQHQNLMQKKIQLEYELQGLNQRRQSHQLSAFEQAQLERDIEQYKYQSEQFNRELAYLQQRQTDFNQQVSSHTQNIQNHQYNIEMARQRFPPREFHKGIFNGREIHVYQFDAEDDLRLTLAHELGHALGLDHHNSPEGLMYPVLADQPLQDFSLQASDKSLFYTRNH